MAQISAARARHMIRATTQRIRLCPGLAATGGCIAACAARADGQAIVLAVWSSRPGFMLRRVGMEDLDPLLRQNQD